MCYRKLTTVGIDTKLVNDIIIIVNNSIEPRVYAVSQLFIKLNSFYGSHSFLSTVFTTTCPCGERDKSSPLFPPTSLRSILSSFSNLCQGSPSCPIPSYFPSKFSSLQDDNSISNNAVKRFFSGTG